MRERWLRWVVVLGLALVVLLGWGPVARYARAARFLQRMGHPSALDAPAAIGTPV